MIIPGKTVISRKYAVLEPLGKGGMGEVFKVRHTSFRTQYAIKTLLPHYAEEEELITRFKEEARKNHSLSNPQNPDQNIVQVIDVDFDPTLNLHYYVMEYIEGKTLTQILREQGTLPLPDILEIAEKVGGALAKAHNLPKPMIHRDISPSNIMIEDQSRRVVVMDFGIAKEEGEEGKTRPDVVIGKPKYCSPEQMGHKPLDGAADIYSLGMVMYELYTGKQFFARLKDQNVIEQVLFDPKENIPHFDPPAPKEFVTLVTRSIAKSRAQRYQRMEEFLQAVERCRSGLPEDTGEKTIFIQPPSNRKKDPEERWRKLEEELRSLSLDFQGRTRTAREQAEEEGADVLAAEFFQQGQAKETEANRLLEDRNHYRAQESYAEAIALFAHASEAAQQATEQARTEMEAVKVAAERYRARTTQAARRFYTEGLMAEGQAREFLDDKRYQHAYEKYAEAQRAFADARDVAHETLRGETESARQQTEAVKEAAREEGADSLAAELFHQAEQCEKQAAEALEQEEFTQAIQLYATARQQYVDARQQAHTEQQRQLALTARQQAQTARQHLEAQEKEYTALPSYGLAVEAQRQGDTQFAEHEYEEAVRAYEQARQGYEQAEQEARREAETGRQRQQAVDARQQAQQAQAVARQAAAPQHAQILYQQAEAVWQRGEQSLGEQLWERAAVEFVRARELFAEAQEQAQQEQARQVAAATREAAREAQQAAAEGATLFPQHWQKVETLLQQAEQALADERYDAAQVTFTESATHFQQLAQAVQDHKRREELKWDAEAAQAQTIEAKRAAVTEGATELAPDALQQAERSLQQAATLLIQEEFTAAKQGFIAAQQQYEVAQQQARQERRHRAALAAREQAETAQRQAVEGGAAGLAPATYQQAVIAQQRGNEQFADEKDYEQAAQQYTRAHVGFVQALREAKQERRRREAAAREQAEATRQRIAEVKRQLQPLEEWWGATQQDAKKRETTAEEDWQAERYEQAATQYTEVLKAYEEALKEAQETQREYHTATEARTQTVQARQAAEAAQALQYAPGLLDQADSVYAQGTQHFQAKRWEAAASAFTQARELFVQARQQAEAAKAKARQAAEAARTAAGEAQQAATAGEQFFPARWQEVETLQQQAEQALAAEQYAAAQQLFTESTTRFQHLAQAVQDHQHREALKRDAEAAKAGAEEARQEALKDEADKFATDAFLRTEQHFQQAVTALTNEHFTQARALFDDARQQYGEALHHAQIERRRQATLTARAQAAVAQRQAVDGGAPELAPQVYQPALSTQQRGNEHFEAGAYEQAEQQYTQAHEGFARALREAKQERHRREATAKERVKASRQHIAEIKHQLQPLEEWWGQTEAQAEQQERIAEQAWQEEQYEQAAERYEQVWRAYEAALSEAQATQRAYQAAVAAHTQGEQARQAAETAQAPQYAAAPLQQAETLQTQGEQQFQEKAWEAAANTFTQARELFAQAQQRARTAKEQARQDAAAARERTAEARAQAERAGAQKRFSQEFAQVQQMTAQGQTCEERQEFAQALTLYQQATQHFVRLKQDVVLLAARERAEKERLRATETKLLPETLKQWTGEKWQAAQRLEAAAERAWQEGDYGQAEEQYRQAAQIYTLARGEAETARQRQPALDAQQQAAQEQASADDAEAQQDAASLYQQAADSQQRGEQSLAAQQWAQAETAFLQAQRFFVQARESAQRTKARRLAAAAREKVLQAQQDAAEGATLLPKQTAEASAVLMEANRAFAREDFTAAETGFARSVEFFQEIQRAVVLHRQKEQAEKAQARARDLQSKVLTVKGRQKRRADRALVEGDRLFLHEQYEEAQAQYREAISLFENLLALSPGQAESPWVLTLARNPAFILSAGVLVLLGFYFSGSFPSRQSPKPPGLAKSAPTGNDNPAIPSTANMNDKEERTSKTPVETAKEESPSPLPTGGSPKEGKGGGITPTRLNDSPSPSGSEETTQGNNPPAGADSERLAAFPPPPPSPPPLREPPRITQVTPSLLEREILVEEGKSLNFTVEAESPQKDTLRYAWFLDGRKQPEGNKKTWTYKPDFEAAGEKPKEVKVEVTNAANLTDKKTWSVRVQDVDQPPRIAQFSPSARSIDVIKGEGLNFSVQAIDPDKEDNRLVYVWSLDGQEVIRGDSKSWQLPTSLSDAPHQVRVSVEDRAGKSDQVAWNVTIKPPQPRIVDFRPREEKININAGEPLDFSVTAAVPGSPDEAKKKLIYQWKINDAAPQRTETGSFRFTETKPGTYQLTAVAISPEGLQSMEKRWSIEVAFVPPPPPPGGEITESDVMKWLEAYKRAWEGKRAEALVQLGEIPPDKANDLQKVLDNYKELRVTLKSIAIDRKENRATVQFTREDTDERGHTEPHKPKTVILEKDPDGQVRRK